MTQKKLEKGSVWEKADTNGDGVVSDREMAMRERMVLLENRDKKEGSKGCQTQNGKTSSSTTVTYYVC